MESRHLNMGRGDLSYTGSMECQDELGHVNVITKYRHIDSFKESLIAISKCMTKSANYIVQFMHANMLSISIWCDVPEKLH